MVSMGMSCRFIAGEVLNRAAKTRQPSSQCLVMSIRIDPSTLDFYSIIEYMSGSRHLPTVQSETFYQYIDSFLLEVMQKRLSLFVFNFLITCDEERRCICVGKWCHCEGSLTLSRV